VRGDHDLLFLDDFSFSTTTVCWTTFSCSTTTVSFTVTTCGVGAAQADRIAPASIVTITSTGR